MQTPVLLLVELRIWQRKISNCKTNKNILSEKLRSEEILRVDAEEDTYSN